jgi:hypothetical protein
VRGTQLRDDGRMAVSVYSRALQKAAGLLGGRDKLARVLQVPKSELDKWIADEAKPPRDLFLRVVDLILDETAPSRDSEPQDPPPSRDAVGAGRQLDD